jgi:hypothetical protein
VCADVRVGDPVALGLDDMEGDVALAGLLVELGPAVIAVGDDDELAASCWVRPAGRIEAVTRATSIAWA